MRLAFFLPLFALIFTGCAGYKIGPIKPVWMQEVNTVAVPSFKNDTLEPRVEVALATALIKQIQQDGTYQVVDEKDADVIIEGTLERIRRRPARSVRTNTLATREYTLELSMLFKVTNRTTGAILDQRGINGRASFFVSGSDAVASDVNTDERQAIPLAAEDAMVQYVSLLSEGW